jgi:hypothetical protein
LGKSQPLNISRPIYHQNISELPPASWLTHINERLNATLAQCQDSLWSLWLKLSEESNGWNPGKLANHTRQPRACFLIRATTHGHQDSSGSTFLEITNDIFHRVSVECSIQPLSCCINPESLDRGEHCRDGGQYLMIVGWRRHERVPPMRDVHQALLCLERLMHHMAKRQPCVIDTLAEKEDQGGKITRIARITIMGSD